MHVFVERKVGWGVLKQEYIQGEKKKKKERVCLEKTRKALCSLPGTCSKGSCESCEYAPEEGVWVLPRNSEVDGGQHQETMDGMSNDTAGYIFPQTGEQ